MKPLTSWLQFFMIAKPPPPEKCSRCGLDPELPENRGKQLYMCDRCHALVCAECSEDEPNEELFCMACDYAVQLGD